MSTAFTKLQAVPIDVALPQQSTGTAGQALISNGTAAGWNTILAMIGAGAGQTTGQTVANTILPSQTGKIGKYLMTDGSGNLTWTDVVVPASGVTSISISGVINTGAVTITNVPSATTAGNVTGIVPISNGGTGATSAAAALSNLGAAPANHNHGDAGMVAFFAQSAAPTGWLKANGAAVSRTTYAALFAIIGTHYGAGNGSTTFNVPDMRGEFARGWDDGRGLDPSRTLGTAQADAVQDHTHYIMGESGGVNNIVASQDSNTDAQFQQVSTGSYRGDSYVYVGNMSSGRIAGETRPHNIALLACIKY